MRSVYRAVCLVLFFVSWNIRAADKPDPRATVESALEHAIASFEQKELGKFIQESIRPKDRDDLLQRTSLEEITKQLLASPEFETHRQGQVAIWKEFKTMTPTYNAAKTMATFPALNKPGVRHSLVFELQQGLWLINVVESVATNTVPIKRDN